MPIFSTGLPVDSRPHLLVLCAAPLPTTTLIASFFNKKTICLLVLASYVSYTINSSVAFVQRHLFSCFTSAWLLLHSFHPLLPIPRTRIYRLFSLFFRASQVPFFFFAVMHLSDLFADSRGFCLSVYLSKSCTQACNTGPYESATATHVTSAYRYRNQRVSFVMRLTHLFYCVPFREDFTLRKYVHGKNFLLELILKIIANVV